MIKDFDEQLKQERLAELHALAFSLQAAQWPRHLCRAIISVSWDDGAGAQINLNLSPNYEGKPQKRVAAAIEVKPAGRIRGFLRRLVG